MKFVSVFGAGRVLGRLPSGRNVAVRAARVRILPVHWLLVLGMQCYKSSWTEKIDCCAGLWYWEFFDVCVGE